MLGEHTYNTPVIVGHGDSENLLETIFRSRVMAGNISFNSTVDAGEIRYRRLRVITYGTTYFGGEVGGSNPFVELKTEGESTQGGPVVFNADITTTGLQSYSGDVTVGIKN